VYVYVRDLVPFFRLSSGVHSCLLGNHINRTEKEGSRFVPLCVSNVVVEKEEEEKKEDEEEKSSSLNVFFFFSSTSPSTK
jgi:hypothetical protein